MKWLFIIDPIQKLKLDSDTTYPIIQEASKQGMLTYIATIQDLYFKKQANVHATRITFKKKYELQEKKIHALDDFTLIFMRKEPPYDITFHYATQLLSLTKAKVVNSPAALRDFNEKLIILNFPQLIPKTVVSSNIQEIIKFILEKEDFFVIKALNSYQGKIIEKLHRKDAHVKIIVKKYTKNGTTPIMVQEFLPNINKGDKRILLLGGKILGAVNRMPKKGSYLSNFGQGGTGVKTIMTKKEKKIALTVAPFLKKNGLHFVGLDVIDGYLTEINITCPTGLQHINKLENKQIEKEVVDYFMKIQ